eukprot:3047632-Rhodomonas_salina.2
MVRFSGGSSSPLHRASACATEPSSSTRPRSTNSTLLLTSAFTASSSRHRARSTLAGGSVLLCTRPATASMGSACSLFRLLALAACVLTVGFARSGVLLRLSAAPVSSAAAPSAAAPPAPRVLRSASHPTRCLLLPSNERLQPSLFHPSTILPQHEAPISTSQVIAGPGWTREWAGVDEQRQVEMKSEDSCSGLLGVGCIPAPALVSGNSITAGRLLKAWMLSSSPLAVTTNSCAYSTICASFARGHRGSTACSHTPASSSRAVCDTVYSLSASGNAVALTNACSVSVKSTRPDARTTASPSCVPSS